MLGRDVLRIGLLVILILAIWATYFAICGAPAGAPFIYADY